MRLKMRTEVVMPFIPPGNNTLVTDFHDTPPECRLSDSYIALIALSTDDPDA